MTETYDGKLISGLIETVEGAFAHSNDNCHGNHDWRGIDYGRMCARCGQVEPEYTIMDKIREEAVNG